MISRNSSAALNPFEWNKTFSGEPVLSSDGTTLRRGLLRRWANTARDMEQPPLDHHLLVLHLGGAKRIRRQAHGSATSSEVAAGALTIVPAGSACRWTTEGPIDFAHLYVHPAHFDRTVVETFDREPGRVNLPDVVGRTDPLLERLLMAMTEELHTPSWSSGLYLDCLFQTALVRLAREHSTLPAVNLHAPLALAPYKLRRVLEYIEARLDGDITLAALSQVSGLSRYHFSRAFQRATGKAPYTYVTQRRVECAKRLLRDPDLRLTEVAHRCGFNSHGQFSTMFKRVTGLRPSQFRNRV